MTGEHFSSATGKELVKTKDPYVRFKWEDKKRVKKAVATILEKEKILRDAVLQKVLEGFYGCSPSVCVLCTNDVDWPLVRFEFYNWEKPNTEKEVFVHTKCLTDEAFKAKLDTLRTLGKNPTFMLELNCLAVDQCAFFSKSGDFRNCQHIVLRFEETTSKNLDGSVNISMAPLLHCKRAHPGQFFLETEKETWWNIQEAGLALMAKNICEILESPQAQAQLEVLKKQHPQYIEGLRKLIRENPTGVAYATAFGALLETYILKEKTYEEMWDELVKNGNDYY